MPRYVYHCSKCEGDFEYFHAMSEKKCLCEVCNEETLLKFPAFSGSIKKEQTKKAGSIVDAYIKDAREELEQEKKNRV